MLWTGNTEFTELLSNMGAGASGMFETIIVTVLVSAICALIREYGGFDAVLAGIKKVFHGKKKWSDWYGCSCRSFRYCDCE